MNTAPSGRYSSFVEKDYLFDARMPAASSEICAFLVKVSNKATGQALFSYSMPMFCRPIHGVVEGDSASLEAATNLVLAQLPAAEDYNAGILERLQGDAGLAGQAVTLTDNIQQ